MVIRNTFEFILWLFHSATDVVHLHSFAEDHQVSHLFCCLFCECVYVCNLSGLCNVNFSLGTSTSYLPLNVQHRNKGTLPRGKHRK